MARILVVDDDPAVRAMLERMLLVDGHEITAATNGTMALRLLDGSSFDLVITDLVMPGIEGMQLLRELRARPIPQKAIAMSGGGRGSASNYLELAKACGAAAILEMPFTRQELVDAIAVVLAPT